MLTTSPLINVHPIRLNLSFLCFFFLPQTDRLISEVDGTGNLELIYNQFQMVWLYNETAVNGHEQNGHYTSNWFSCHALSV